MKRKMQYALTVGMMTALALGIAGTAEAETAEAETACESEAASYGEADPELTESIENALELTGLPYEITVARDDSRNDIYHMTYQFADGRKDAFMEKLMPEEDKAYFVFYFTTDREEPFELPFHWEDWKQEISFAETVTGEFETAGALYEELSSRELPETEESYDCQFTLGETFCTARFHLMPTRIEPHLADPVTQNKAVLVICIYEDQQLYENVMEGRNQAKLEYEKELAKTQK